MRSILFSLCLILACTSRAATVDGAAPAMRYDHFNPVVLNEFALQKYRDGDLRSALILLERAHLLAPHDARIRRNLGMLRAQRDGKPFVEDAAVDTAAVDTAAVGTAAATQVSGVEPLTELPIGPLWKKPGQ